MKSIENIKEITADTLNSTELFLVEVKISKDNHIEIFIDAQDGVPINRCIDISRELEEKFDREEEDFTLTVSSAGIGYPFKVEGQFRKNIGKAVQVLTTGEKSEKLEGILKAYDGGAIVLEYQEKKAIEGKKKKELVTTEKTIPLTDIKEIKSIIRF